MNLRTRLKRASIAAVAVLVIFGAGAFADTQSTRQPVTLANVQGQRILQVTGSDLLGPASLAFGRTDTQAPFGVIVTDFAHARTGYDVTATLSDLYKVDPAQTNGYDCNESVASSSFAVGFGTVPVYDPEIAATLDSLLTFTGYTADLADGAVKTLLTSANITKVQATVQGLTTDVATTVTLMNVADGDNTTSGTSFTDPAPHACAPSLTGASSRFLQTGTTASGPTGSDFLTDFFDVIESDDANTEATPTEVVNAGVLLTGTDTKGGQLYDATYAELQSLLVGVDLGTLTLDDITTAIVGVMDTISTDIVLDLIGQSGIYANVPVLNYTPDPNAVTGLYQGTMTVTLTDK